jgi:two-component system OmpR family response regulator/two-component system response regulator ChvI
MRVLLVEDDDAIAAPLAEGLQREGLEVERVATGADALAASDADLVLLDLGLPDLDGLDVCRALRARSAVPIIVITARGEELDRVLGLELGADDYVAKPFNSRVLLARVKALLRRQVARKEQTFPTLRVGRLSLDAERLSVHFAEQPIVVTVTEFRLLEALASRPGVVFNRDRLMELARGDDSVVAERIIDTYVRRLRRKLEAVADDFDEIETVIGAGYRWRG